MTFPAACCLLLSATLTVRVAAGPDLPQQPEKVTTLSVAESAAQAGAPVVAPLTLSPAAGVAVGAVEVRLTHPKALLAFVKIEPSGLALGVDAVVEAEVKAGPDAKSSTLHVRVFTAPGSGRALPSGPLAYLGFKISDSAKPETAITLVHAAEALTTGRPRQPVTRLAAANAIITVARPPVPACFFYMH